jgi:hypothetical protein
VNDFLDRAAAGKLGVRLEQPRDSQEPEGRPWLLSALLMIFASVVVYTRGLPPSLVHSVWFERIGFLVLVALGAAMIRLAVRS